MRRFILGAVVAASALIPAIAVAQTSASPFTYGTRYDAMRRVVGTIAPDPDGTGPLTYLATRNSYDARGFLTKVERGRLSGWRAETIAPASWSGFTVHQVVTATYDNAGRKLVETVTASGVVVNRNQWSWDTSDRVVCQTVRMNPTTNFSAAPADACTLGAEGGQGPDRITRTLYDAPGRISTVQKAYGTALQQDYVAYTYTPNGKQATVTDANGATAAYAYDGLDRLQRWSFPSKTSAGAPSATDYEEYGYDARDNRTSLRKRDGRTITYSYDALNRVSSKGYPNGGARAVHYGYDLRGLQTYARFDAPGGEGVTNVYDGPGRLSSSTTALGGSSRTLNHLYDADGNRVRITHPDGVYFTMGHDGLDRMASASWWSLTSGTVPFMAVTYNSAGLRSNMNRASSHTGYSYDGTERLTNQDQRFAGAVGNTTSAFGYNSASQMTSRTRDNDAYAFTGSVSVSRSYTVNGLNQYTSAGPATFGYDGNGNLTSDGSTGYGYDIENRLISATNGTTLAYDPLGRLWQTSGGSGTTQFLYDGDALVAEYAGSGGMLRRYMHGPGVDEPILWDEGAALSCASTRFLHTDHQGSVIALADCNGNRTAVRAYDEYGIPNAGQLDRFQYTGQAWLPELGMYYYKARIYSPTLGRFLQTDPIGYKDQVNLYAYVGNDPVNGRDPSGTQCAGRTCTIIPEVKNPTVGQAIVIGAATVAATIWNAGVHLYERVSSDEPERKAEVYHRLESPSQTPRDATMQERTGIVGGYAARGSDIPTVKAYTGPLPEGRRGIEFTTAVEPSSGSVPGQPKWYPNQPGVGLIPGEKGPMAVIPVIIVKNTQRVDQ